MNEAVGEVSVIQDSEIVLGYIIGLYDMIVDFSLKFHAVAGKAKTSTAKFLSRPIVITYSVAETHPRPT